MATSILSAFSTGHSDMMHDAQLDFYGRRLATCGADHCVKVFDVEGGAQTGELPGCVGGAVSGAARARARARVVRRGAARSKAARRGAAAASARRRERGAATVTRFASRRRCRSPASLPRLSSSGPPPPRAAARSCDRAGSARATADGR